MSWNILRIFWTKDADLEHRETCFKQSERNTNENLNKIQQNFQKDMKDDYQRIPTRISNNFHRRVEWEKRKLHSVSKNCRNDIKESEKKIARVSTLVLAGVFRLHQVIKNTRQETEIKRKRIYMYIYIYIRTHTYKDTLSALFLPITSSPILRGGKEVLGFLTAASRSVEWNTPDQVEFDTLQSISFYLSFCLRLSLLVLMLFHHVVSRLIKFGATIRKWPKTFSFLLFLMRFWMNFVFIKFLEDASPSKFFSFFFFFFLFSPWWHKWRMMKRKTSFIKIFRRIYYIA